MKFKVILKSIADIKSEKHNGSWKQPPRYAPTPCKLIATAENVASTPSKLDIAIDIILSINHIKTDFSTNGRTVIKSITNNALRATKAITRSDNNFAIKPPATAIIGSAIIISYFKAGGGADVG